VNATAAAWAAIVALGLYHGLNPGMGWPLAVANGMTMRRDSAVFATLLPLAGGHFLAMAVVLVPFAALSWYAEWSRGIRLGAGSLVILFGAWRLIVRRHPRAIARVRPTEMAWWSFLMATAHGAGLMVLPFMLGLCTTTSTDPAAAGPQGWAGAGHAAVMDYLVRSNSATAVAAAALHTVAMVLAGAGLAWAVYRYLGLQFLRRSWLNLEFAWGISLVIAGVTGVAMAL
jgi:hypothetical protein